jgi:hypothetical protein
VFVKFISSALMLSILFFVPRRAVAQSNPVVCNLGTYITSINNIDTAAGTFDAEFWMWSICPDDEIRPLDTLEFVNGDGVEGSLDATLPRGGRWWSTRKFSGTFRADFDLQNYPFDRQTLNIEMEEAVLDERGLRYSADIAESQAGPRVHHSGWQLGDLVLTAGTATHPTTFGDPSLPGGTSRYASMKISIVAERVYWETFLRVTFPLYIVALLVFASLMLNITSESMFLGRMGVLGTMLFSVVLSFSSTGDYLGEHEGMYLLDLLHIVVLTLIVVATAWAILAHHQVTRGFDPTAIDRRDRFMMIGLASGFVILNVILIILARVNG